MENPCVNCSEAEKKRPRCKSLKCPMYFEHLEEDKKMDKLLSSIKVFAKNNMCASCFSDMENFINVMEDIIDGGENIFLKECIDELHFNGLTIDEGTLDLLLREEAKVWLKDYYKHRKDYDPEEIIIDLTK